MFEQEAAEGAESQSGLATNYTDESENKPEASSNLLCDLCDLL
jgi:hypothetical protein